MPEIALHPTQVLVLNSIFEILLPIADSWIRVALENKDERMTRPRDDNLSGNNHGHTLWETNLEIEDHGFHW